jgi:hypothetical protein
VLPALIFRVIRYAPFDFSLFLPFLNSLLTQISLRVGLFLISFLAKAGDVAAEVATESNAPELHFHGLSDPQRFHLHLRHCGDGPLFDRSTIELSILAALNQSWRPSTVRHRG